MNIKSFYSQYIEFNDLVFDIGANEGTRTELFLELGANVVSVEPIPSCQKNLEIKFENNPNWSLYKGGLSNYSGTSEFYICDMYSGLSSINSNWVKSRPEGNKAKKLTKISINVTTFDKLIELYGLPKFCKIDVEGYEFTVFQGLTKSIPIISFEFHRANRMEASRCMKYLMTIGQYEFNYSLRESFELNLSTNTRSPNSIIEKISKIKKEWEFGDIYCFLRN